MEQILFDYKMNPTTWVYLSTLLTIGIFFKFRRFWSVRNLDLLALIAFSPGLLLFWYAKDSPVREQLEQLGYVWLFCTSGFFLFRLLLDPVMVRRPLLEPNLSASGLTFTGAALLVFLIANVITEKLSDSDLDGARRSDEIIARREPPAEKAGVARRGPGYPLFYLLGQIPNSAIGAHKSRLEQEHTTRTTAILAHLAVVIGIILIGYRHFDNIHTGVAAASLFLLLPYTAQMTGHVDHVVPGALLVWAVAAYRRPVVAGILLGLSAGVIYYPLFLLPLWISFYWQRGLVRFLSGFVAVLVLLAATLVLTSSSVASFLLKLHEMFDWTHLFSSKGLDGFWRFHEPAYRIPVVAAYIALCGSLFLWPAQKNLGTLLSCSAAVMLGTQFWDSQQGGTYMAWYLPLLLLTIFRPNLEDRVAVTAVSEGWFWVRRLRPAPVAKPPGAG
jgi:hypothetical protein